MERSDKERSSRCPLFGVGGSSSTSRSICERTNSSVANRQNIKKNKVNPCSGSSDLFLARDTERRGDIIMMREAMEERRKLGIDQPTCVCRPHCRPEHLCR